MDRIKSNLIPLPYFFYNEVDLKQNAKNLAKITFKRFWALEKSLYFRGENYSGKYLNFPFKNAKKEAERLRLPKNIKFSNCQWIEKKEFSAFLQANRRVGNKKAYFKGYEIDVNLYWLFQEWENLYFCPCGKNIFFTENSVFSSWIFFENNFVGLDETIEFFYEDLGKFELFKKMIDFSKEKWLNINAAEGFLIFELETLERVGLKIPIEKGQYEIKNGVLIKVSNEPNFLFKDIFFGIGWFSKKPKIRPNLKNYQYYKLDNSFLEVQKIPNWIEDFKKFYQIEYAITLENRFILTFLN